MRPKLTSYRDGAGSVSHTSQRWRSRFATMRGGLRGPTGTTKMEMSGEGGAGVKGKKGQSRRRRMREGRREGGKREGRLRGGGLDHNADQVRVDRPTHQHAHAIGTPFAVGGSAGRPMVCGDLVIARRVVAQDAPHSIEAGLRPRAETPQPRSPPAWSPPLGRTNPKAHEGDVHIRNSLARRRAKQRHQCDGFNARAMRRAPELALPHSRWLMRENSIICEFAVPVGYLALRMPHRSARDRDCYTSQQPEPQATGISLPRAAVHVHIEWLCHCASVVARSLATRPRTQR